MSGRGGDPGALGAADEELLELATVQVPWFMVCGEFHARYGSPGALARRLLELRELGFLDVLAGDASEPPGAEALEADALDNDCYRDLEDTRDPRWTVVATDAGVARIAHRLARE